jgi:hypothetical protein
VHGRLEGGEDPVLSEVLGLRQGRPGPRLRPGLKTNNVVQPATFLIQLHQQANDERHNDEWTQITMSATPKQRDFFDQLLRERQIPAEYPLEDIHALLVSPDVTPAQLRPVFDELCKLPKKAARPGAPSSARPQRTDQVLRDLEIPPAMYALASGAFLPADRTLLGGDDNDHVFLAVGEYKDTRYIRRLHGAPGSFSRTKLPDRDLEQRVARVIHAEGPRNATQLFGSLYTCCGKCGAELTDKVSRALKLGPHCRKEFGL